MTRIIPQQAHSDTADSGQTFIALTALKLKLGKPKPGHPPRCYAPRRQTGVTMLELAFVLTVLAMLMMLAVPSFNELIQSNRLSADSSNVLTQLAYARSEATKRRARIVICSSRDQMSCEPSSGGDWTAGWVVFADANADGNLAVNAPPCPTDTPTTTSDCVLRVQGILSANDQLNNTAKLASIVMRADGSLANSTEPVQFTLCTDKTLAREKEHEIILGIAGNASHNPFTCATGKRH